MVVVARFPEHLQSLIVCILQNSDLVRADYKARIELVGNDLGFGQR